LQRACDNPFSTNPQTYPQLFVDIAKATTPGRNVDVCRWATQRFCCSAELAPLQRFALESARKQPK
jgi:hypothetical protein